MAYIETRLTSSESRVQSANGTVSEGGYELDSGAVAIGGIDETERLHPGRAHDLTISYFICIRRCAILDDIGCIDATT